MSAHPSSLTACPVVHADDALIAVAKPAGVLSHPNPTPRSRGKQSPASPSAFLGPYDPGDRRFDTPGGPVWLLHRLDQETSGILLGATSESAAAALRSQFDSGALTKSYDALVFGTLPPKGTWKDALESVRKSGQVRTSLSHGRPINAVLHFATTAASRPLRLSLLRVELVTGRTHQIRVQAAARSHPVLGDSVYGDFTLNRWARQELGLNRLFLHAASIDLTYPGTGRALRLECPLPPDLSEVLAAARISR